MKRKGVLVVISVTAVLSVGATAGALTAYQHQRESADQAEYAQMACSFHDTIRSADRDAAGKLVQIVSNAVRSENQPLWAAAYRLQQDVVKYGADSVRVRTDRGRVSQLCSEFVPSP